MKHLFKNKQTNKKTSQKQKQPFQQMFKQAVRHPPGQTKAAGTGIVESTTVGQRAAGTGDSGERYGGTVLCGISGTHT